MMQKVQDRPSIPDLNVLGRLCALGLGITYILSKSEGRGIPCPSRLLLQLPCPGCGLTRSWTALWRGELEMSLRYHPLGIPLFLICLALVGAFLVHIRRPNSTGPFRLQSLVFHPCTLKIAAALLLGVWGMRMGLAWTGSTYFLW